MIDSKFRRLPVHASPKEKADSLIRLFLPGDIFTAQHNLESQLLPFAQFHPEPHGMIIPGTAVDDTNHAVLPFGSGQPPVLFRRKQGPDRSGEQGAHRKKKSDQNAFHC